jgi:hypothetical protein
VEKFIYCVLPAVVLLWKLAKFVIFFNLQMFPIPTTTTLNKFGWLAEKYRITQNGFVEQIPVPESEPDASPHLNPTSTSNEDIDDSSSKMQE